MNRTSTILGATFFATAFLVGASGLLAQDHEEPGRNLQGKILEVATDKFMSPSALIKKLTNYKHILIGERHGRKAHQEREAFILAAFAGQDFFPDLYLEMLTQDQSQIVADYVSREPEYSGRLARNLEWAQSNWPSWHYYQRIFDTALIAKLKIHGADLPAKQKAELNTKDDFIEAYELQIVESWRASMKRAHCNLIDDDRLSRATQLQIQRDKAMALSMLENSDIHTPTVLLAGSAHTRKDRGVPRYLDAGKTVSVALLEAEPGQTVNEIVPSSVTEGSKVYDYIWFTPKVKKKTLCDRLEAAN